MIPTPSWTGRSESQAVGSVDNIRDIKVAATLFDELDALGNMAGRLEEIITFNPWTEEADLAESADEVANEEYVLAPEYQEE